MNGNVEMMKKTINIGGMLKDAIVYVFMLVTLSLLLLASVAFAEEPVQLASIQGFDGSVIEREYIRPEFDQNNVDMPQGIDAATCAVAGPIQAVVEGPTELEFWWRGSDSGIIVFYVNGKAESAMLGDTGWEKLHFSVKEEGPYVIKWVFKDQDDG